MASPSALRCGRNSPGVRARKESPEIFVSEPSFYYFVQYHLHRQLKEVTEYIHSQAIILKGDIAIGVSRFGADAWQSPDLFHMEYQAGAPPDAFGVKGQNWGFPTYNWPRMKETGFAWWKRRFEQMDATLMPSASITFWASSGSGASPLTRSRAFSDSSFQRFRTHQRIRKTRNCL